MQLHIVLITLGALFLLGLAADVVGRRTRLPRVTLLLGCGLAVGHSGLDLLPAEAQSWYEFLTITALTMVAFLLGGSLSLETLSRHGRAILAVSLAVTVATLIVVGFGLWALGFGLPLALALAAIAPATDPAATQDVIRQSGAEGEFVDTIKGVVAVDDAWGLLAFSFVMVAVGMLDGAGRLDHLAHAAWEIGGALALGVGIGLPAAAATGRLQPGEPQQSEALGVVFLSAGLSIWLDVSFLLAGMTAGAVVVNRARHHVRPFHEIENIEWPFMILFFIMAGASLEVERLSEIGALGAAYVALRILARVIGGWIGGVVGRAPAAQRPWFGPALLPQAGVAVGMALVAADYFPEMGETVLSLTIGTTVIFELIGPAATLFAIRRAQPQNSRPPSGTS
jgi:Kef-type K+ transport system membrane component KefB